MDFNLLIVKQQEINWDDSTRQIILAVITQFFSMDAFSRWMGFLNGIDQGIPGITEPNHELANKIRATFFDIIKKQNILSISVALGYQNPMICFANHEHDLVGRAIKWKYQNNTYNGIITTYNFAEGEVGRDFIIQQNDNQTAYISYFLDPSGGEAARCSISYGWAQPNEKLNFNDILVNVPNGYDLFFHNIKIKHVMGYMTGSLDDYLNSPDLLNDLAAANVPK